LVILAAIWLDAVRGASPTIAASKEMGEQMMVRWMGPRLTVGLFAAGIVLLTAGSAWAFSRETVSPDGGNYSFGDPDKQPTSSDNHTSSQSTRPFGSTGPVVQFGVQQGSTFGQGTRYNTPDPYFRPLTNGN
jgi:hypothetical protein